MIFVALEEAASKGELLLVEGGMCRWHRRRDGVVVVREILVLPDARRRGVGRAMLSEVLRVNGGRVLRAKCPEAYESGNAFWAAMAFTKLSAEGGVNLWQRPASQ